VKKILPLGISLEQVDIWFQDESRIGQQGSLTRIWAPRGSGGHSKPGDGHAEETRN
jgi:hypothetical protein